MIANQEAQLDRLDHEAAGALHAKAEVVRLAEREAALSKQTVTLQATVERQKGLLEAGEGQVRTLRKALDDMKAAAAASGRMASSPEEFRSKEALLLDKILGLQVDLRKTTERTEAAEVPPPPPVP